MEFRARPAPACRCPVRRPSPRNAPLTPVSGPAGIAPAQRAGTPTPRGSEPVLSLAAASIGWPTGIFGQTHRVDIHPTADLCGTLEAASKQDSPNSEAKRPRCFRFPCALRICRSPPQGTRMEILRHKVQRVVLLVNPGRVKGHDIPVLQAPEHRNLRLQPRVFLRRQVLNDLHLVPGYLDALMSVEPLVHHFRRTPAEHLVGLGAHKTHNPSDDPSSAQTYPREPRCYRQDIPRVEDHDPILYIVPAHPGEAPRGVCFHIDPCRFRCWRLLARLCGAWHGASLLHHNDEPLSSYRIRGDALEFRVPCALSGASRCCRTRAWPFPIMATPGQGAAELNTS